MNLPIDLAFTVATTATADLLATRATTDVTNGAGGNGALQNIVSAGLTLAQAQIKVPTKNFWLMSYNLEVDAPCVVQVGLLNAAGDAFVPLDTHVCTLAAAGGLAVSGTAAGLAGVPIPLSLTGPYRFALRVSGYGAATAVRVSGNFGLYTNEA